MQKDNAARIWQMNSNTISDVKKKMDQQASERSRLALENEVLRTRFKEFFEKYDAREKDLAEQQKSRDTELKG